MRTLRCKCGEMIAHTSGTMKDCEGCEKCNTTYAGHPNNHSELQPHKWGTKYNQNTGKKYKECNVCYLIDIESYKKAEKK